MQIWCLTLLSLLYLILSLDVRIGVCWLELSFHFHEKEILLTYRSLMCDILIMFQINLLENLSQNLQSIEKYQFVSV